MNRFFYLFAIGLLYVLFFPITPLYAHIDSDSMPDAVAEMEYKIYLEFKPDDIRTLNKLGMVYFRQNKLKEAAASFEHVLKLSPVDFHASYAMGLVEAKKGDHDTAVRFFNKAIAIDNDDALVYFHLGRSLEMLGKFTEALHAFRESLKKSSAPSNHNCVNQSDIARIKEAIQRIEGKTKE